MAKASR